jgi:hypothetical protein
MVGSIRAPFKTLAPGKLAEQFSIEDYRVGGRYHGGIWCGTGRHYWRGRWWPYGVGDCWLLTPIGYVWVCG